jgi:Chain length determinant protein
MDLISIVRALWRHRLITIPIVMLTAIGAVYIVAVKPPIYEANSELLLLSPPAPPTPAQIAVDPKLRKIPYNNPYVNFGDLPIVADAVQSVVTSAAAQEALAKQGVNPDYQVTLSSDTSTPPILEITGIGKTQEEAILGAKLVTQAANSDLYQLQKAQGVNDYYLIRGTVLVQPDTAQLSVSGKLRSLVAVLALGAILLFVGVSTMDVVGKRRNAAAEGARSRGHRRTDQADQTGAVDSDQAPAVFTNGQDTGQAQDFRRSELHTQSYASGTRSTRAGGDIMTQSRGGVHDDL